MLSNFADIAGIVLCGIIILGLIVGFARGGFNIFGKINKIDQIERNVNVLLLLHATELIALYKDKIKLVVSNPSTRLYPDKDELLDKLQRGHLASSEANRLTQILREEEAEASRSNQQMAVLVIGALLLLIDLTSSQEG